MSLSSQILLALVAGIASGVFFGETLAVLEVAGEVFVRLLQMTALPYVAVSLITGLGRLTYAEARTLALKGGAVLAALWAAALVVVVSVPFAFPQWEAASFFSTTLVEPPKEFHFVDLYVPANPFHSLANAVVPAVVFFCIAVGLALIGVERKALFIDNLAVLADALMRITKFAVRLTPVGVFAIAASAAGTMSVQELGRVQVYLVTYIAAACLLTFWILPALVTALTPLRYRDVVGASRDALATAFATANLLIVLPILAERSRELLEKCRLRGEDTTAMVDVLVPASFNFPHVGKLLTLTFVLFAAWFSGLAVSAGEYPAFLLAGVLSFFGHVNVAVPFLLDFLQVPADTFQLFVVTGILLGRFGTMLSAMHTLVLAILGTCAIVGGLRIAWHRVARYLALSAALLVGVMGGVGAVLTYGLENQYRKDEIIAGMHLLRDPVAATVHETTPGPLAEDGRLPRLARIRQRGYLRVGYLADNLPFAYFNASGELVGFDVEMAHTLARELGVHLVFVPVDRMRVADELDAGACDIVMSGFVVTTERSERMAFSTSYLSETLAYVVKDHRRRDFASREAVRRLEAPRIAAPDVPYYLAKLRGMVPRAEIVLYGSPAEVFERGLGDEVDAVLFTAERGAAWSLLHPGYSVAVPHPDVVSVPLAYPMPRGERDLVDFINTWIELKRQDRTIETLYEYWILGKEAVVQTPRWSVVRDVLGWVD